LSSVTGLNDLSIGKASRPAGLLRDIRFRHPQHKDKRGRADNRQPHEEEEEEKDSQYFSVNLKLSAVSSSCDALKGSFHQSSDELASALGAESVLTFVGIRAANQKSFEDAAEAPAVATSVVSGEAHLVISDFEDGSSDRYAEIITANGETVVVGGPGSNDAVEQSQWSAMRSGDHVELEVEDDEVGSLSEDNIVLALADAVDNGLGQAYKHARSRRPFVAVKKHKPHQDDEDKMDKVSPMGVVKLIVIRVKYTNSDPDSMCTTSCVQSNLWTGSRNVDYAYRDASYGAMSIPQSYGKIITVSLPVASTSYSSCNNLAAISAAADAAVASQYPSVSLSAYTSRLYMTSAICGIGVAYIGGTPGKAFVNHASADTIAHELGHNFGMQHSNRDPGDDNSVDESYGDRTCIMGYSGMSLRGFNAIHRIENGWIPSSAIMDLSTGCSGRIVRLAPLANAKTSGAIVAIRAVRRKFGRYVIAFRNTAGYDGLQSTSYSNRVHIEYQITKGGQTQLIAMLGAGQSWSQANGDLVVTVSSIGTSGAVVTVKYCRPSTFAGLAGTLSCGSLIQSTNVGAPNVVGYSSGDKLYAVTLNSAYKYTFSTCGSSLDTSIRVFTDGMYEQKTLCDNCGTCASNENNAVITGFTGSGTYIIAVEGYNTASGNFVLSMGCTPING
jgi:hypothetical protein